ncbi:MAG: SpoVR family protein [Alphaproteobacteria bacterium]|nr:SpoVR family protein [Alphaproteobacteria bacterium]
MAHESYFFRARRGLPRELQEAQTWIEGIASGYGLQFCETVFEMCDWQEINMLASYGGFPTRYPHWRWGMDYLQMDKSYEYGLQKIYEMVINTQPAYAYLLDNNTMMDQKLVMAHVYGHVDFFTNNAWFAHTDRKMLDRMANHATRVRRHMDAEGQDVVETFIDMCLSIENLIDPHLPHIRRERSESEREKEAARRAPGYARMPARHYMDKYINPPEFLEEQRQRHQDRMAAQARFPDSPVRDVLGFLLEHGRMRPWQRDVLSIIRSEAYYFAPQGQTKIMNEGWASYWHTTMMTRDILTDAEVIDYCDHHSGTVAMQPGRLNPYKVGIELFRHIEDRWDKGRFGKDWMDCDDVAVKRDWDTGAGLGRDKIFEVRRTHNDVTFIDEFLTEDFVREQGLFTTTWDKKAGHYVVDSREFGAVKQQMLTMLASRGNPPITVTDANHGNRGELELTHAHEGMDLQLDWAELTLGNIARIWGRAAHLVTTVDGRRTVLHHDGASFTVDKEGKPGAGEKQQKEAS